MAGPVRLLDVAAPAYLTVLVLTITGRIAWGRRQQRADIGEGKHRLEAEGFGKRVPIAIALTGAKRFCVRVASTKRSGSCD